MPQDFLPSKSIPAGQGKAKMGRPPKAKMGRPPKKVVGVSASIKRVRNLDWEVTNCTITQEDLKKENASLDEIFQAEQDLQMKKDALELASIDKQDAKDRKKVVGLERICLKT